MKLLAGGTKALFGELLGPLYLSARVLGGGEPTYGNDGTLQAPDGNRPCKARVDNATHAMRDADGYVETDRAISILASSLTGELTTDYDVEILEGDYAGSTFHISSIDRPPGASYFLCRGVLKHG